MFRRWFSQPPRAPEEGKIAAWARQLVAWLDKQEGFVPHFDSVVEIVFTSTAGLGVNKTVYHGLSIRVVDPAVPNCIWIICGIRHSGVYTPPAGNPAVSVFYVNGVVAKNSIDLRFLAPNLTVDGANPLTVILAFIPEPIPRAMQ